MTDTQPLDHASLSAAWNTPGRLYLEEMSRRLTKLYGGDDSVDLELEDPRSKELGEQVLAAVVSLRGKPGAAKELFDPAYAPLFPHVKEEGTDLPFVTILGDDDLLVRTTAPYEEGAVVRLRAGRVERLPADVVGVTRSSNGALLAVAGARGIEIRSSLDSDALYTYTWPEAKSTEAGSGSDTLASEGFLLESMSLSDDGKTLALSCYRRGIYLATFDERAHWQCLHPTPGEEEASDMTHVAVSRDGLAVAWGHQDSEHLSGSIIHGKLVKYPAEDPASSYPHATCFSDDGRFVIFNSCHFYNGETLCVDRHTEGADPVTIDDCLRVYAACWLPPRVTKRLGDEVGEGAFLLGGSGIFRIVTPRGKLLAAQTFGSSASSVSFDEATGQLALASYSGIVHIYDTKTEELPGRAEGWNCLREVRRWLLWESLPDGAVCW